VKVSPKELLDQPEIRAGLKGRQGRQLPRTPGLRGHPKL